MKYVIAEVNKAKRPKNTVISSNQNKERGSEKALSPFFLSLITSKNILCNISLKVKDSQSQTNGIL